MTDTKTINAGVSLLSTLGEQLCSGTDKQTKKGCSELENVLNEMIPAQYSDETKAKLLISQRPFFENGNMERFQLLAKNYVAKLPANLQLAELNTLQKGLPFKLAHPSRERMEGSVKYGYADLYRFLGYPFGEGMAHLPFDKDTKKGNPFYAPYGPVPDAQMNDALKKVLEQNPMYKLAAMLKMAKSLNREYSGNEKGMNQDDRVKSLKKQLINFLEMYGNPLRKKIPILPEDLPIASYRHKNFNHMLRQFMNAQQMKDILKVVKKLEKINGEDSDDAERRKARKKKEASKKKSKTIKVTDEFMR